VKAILCSIVIVFSLLTSCAGGPPQTKEAVRDGVVKYISKRSDMMMSSMDVDVASVAFKQGEAEATVSFTAKGAPPGGSMTMNYLLEAKGKEWVVKSRRDTSGGVAGANPHGGMAPSMEGGAQAMPPGHPSIEKPPAEKKQ
jgi:hypothetical protein